MLTRSSGLFPAAPVFLWADWPERPVKQALRASCRKVGCLGERRQTVRQED